MNTLDYYSQLGDESLHLSTKQLIEEAGYSAFRLLVDQLERAVKLADETNFAIVEERIRIANQMFPEPVKFSPTWQLFWVQIRTKLHWKRHAYEVVPAVERTGEWQIIMDNPYTNQEVVCYPGLSFLEAAYLFGYFKPTLEINEYIRLQKVVTALNLEGVNLFK
jgi:hypothetical protein